MAIIDLTKERLNFLKMRGFIPHQIIDIGACMGTWGEMVHDMWPQSEIFMIEANSDYYQALAVLKFIKGFKISLLGSKKKKSINFYISKIDKLKTGSSVYKEKTHLFDDYTVRKLPMNTLDNIILEWKLDKIDLIKIDTQGSELDIIRGGRKTISKAEFVILETQILEYNRKAPRIESIILEMKRLGFWVFDIVQMQYLPTGELLHIDIMFAKNQSKYIKRGKLA